MPPRHSLLDFCKRSQAPVRCCLCRFQTVQCKAPGCIHNGSLHAPLTIRQLSVCSSQGYLFPSKPFSFNTCKYTKASCFCQGICLYSLTTYCNKVPLFIPFTQKDKNFKAMLLSYPVHKERMIFISLIHNLFKVQ